MLAPEVLYSESYGAYKTVVMHAHAYDLQGWAVLQWSGLQTSLLNLIAALRNRLCYARQAGGPCKL